MVATDLPCCTDQVKEDLARLVAQLNAEDDDERATLEAIVRRATGRIDQLGKQEPERVSSSNGGANEREGTYSLATGQTTISTRHQSSRRSSAGELLRASVAGFEGDVGASAKRIVTEAERAMQLPAYLKAVWDEPPPPDALAYARMYSTLARVLRDSEGPTEAIDAWALAWRLEAQGRRLVCFVRELASPLQRMQKLARLGLVGRVMIGLVITYADLVSDVLLTAEYMSQGRTLVAVFTIAFPAALLLVHALISATVDRASAGATLLALLGAKPAIDSWRMLAGKPPRHGALLPTGVTYSLGRSAEVGIESIPQAVTQCVVLLAGGVGSVTTLQLVALASCFVTTGYVVANVELDNDTNPKYRRDDPVLHGWMGSGVRKYVLLALLTAFATCTCAAKVVAWSSLAVRAPLMFAAWLTTELVLWSASRSFLGAYVYVNRGAPRIISHLFGVFTLLVISAALLPFFRNPMYTTFSPPFAMTCAALALVDSFAMLYAADAHNAAWSLATAATGAALVLLAAIVTLGVPRYRWLWYRHYTLRDHFREYFWDTKVSYTHGPTLEDHRARLLECWCPRYWDEAQVRPWLAEGWPRWSTAPPVWFTGKWKRGIPRELLPEGALVPMSRQWSARMAYTFKLATTSSSRRMAEIAAATRSYRVRPSGSSESGEGDGAADEGGGGEGTEHVEVGAGGE